MTTTGSNVVEFLRRSADRVPDRPALVFGGDSDANESLIFSRLWERCDRLSRGFETEGLETGDRAILMIPMSPGLYAAMLGLLKLGAVAVFVDPWVGARQIAAFSSFAEPRAYVGIGKSHLLRVLDKRLRSVPITVTTGRRLWRWPARRTLAELESHPGDGRIQDVTLEDPALITFTSGSSGLPKGTNRTHGFLTAQHHALKSEFPYDDDDVDMPMFPIFALNNLGLGITSVVPQMDFTRVDAVDPGVILEQMERHGVTTCTASPPFFDRVTRHVASGKGKRPRLRRILTGGAPVSDRQLRDWAAILPETEIVVVYGSTEAEPVAHLEASERLQAARETDAAAPGYCTGRPTNLIETRIVRLRQGPISLDETGWSGIELSTHEIGELVVTGDHVSKHYYRNPDAVRENKIVDPAGKVWHRMGDTGYLDERGRFWLVGRVHSTIVRRGEAVHPQLVEQSAVGDDERIRRAAAVGVPDEQLGERVVLVIETSNPDEDLLAEIETRLSAAGQTADDIVVHDESLPVDPRHNSKIDYERLRQRLRRVERS